MVRLVTIPLPIPFLGDVAFLIGLAGLFTLALRDDGVQALLVRLLFPDLHGSVANRALFQDRLTTPVAGQPRGIDGHERHRRSRFMRREQDDAAGRPSDVRRRGVQRHEAIDRLSGTDDGRGLSVYAARFGIDVIIVISALPIALSANIARVMLTGYIMHFVNPQFALGTYHTLEGLVMMGFGLALLHCECCILDLFFRLAAGESETGASADPAHARPLAVSST